MGSIIEDAYPLSFTLLLGISDIPWALAWCCKLSFLSSERHLRSDKSQTFSENLNFQLISQFENLELCSSLSILQGLPKYLCFNHWGRMISDRSTLSSPGLCLLGALNHLCSQPSKMQILIPGTSRLTVEGHKPIFPNRPKAHTLSLQCQWWVWKVLGSELNRVIASIYWMCLEPDSWYHWCVIKTWSKLCTTTVPWPSMASTSGLGRERSMNPRE